MTCMDMHPEDVKAAIRKEFGTIKAFLEAHELPPTAFADLYRHRGAKRTKLIIDDFLSQVDGRAKPSSAAA